MGMPAARVTDMHVCPMVTPAPVPIPHVGGPILPPCAVTVLIGGLPAARISDLALCVGPPDVIVKGSTGVMIMSLPAARMFDNCAHGGLIVTGMPTVLIGETMGGGGAGGGGAGGSDYQGGGGESGGGGSSDSYDDPNDAGKQGQTSKDAAMKGSKGSMSQGGDHSKLMDKGGGGHGGSKGGQAAGGGGAGKGPGPGGKGGQAGGGADSKAGSYASGGPPTAAYSGPGGDPGSKGKQDAKGTMQGQGDDAGGKGGGGSKKGSGLGGGAPLPPVDTKSAKGASMKSDPFIGG